VGKVNRKGVEGRGGKGLGERGYVSRKKYEIILEGYGDLVEQAMADFVLFMLEGGLDLHIENHLLNLGYNIEIIMSDNKKIIYLVR
jgi:hypothetical protein